MLKVKLTLRSDYCRVPTTEVVYDYDGTQEEFDIDDGASTEILNMLMCGSFPHYYLDCEFSEEEEDEED